MIRVLLNAGLVVGLILLCQQLAVAASPESPARAVTLTYLKAEVGQRAALEQFIRANWLAMDEIAVEQGLFASYRLLETRAGEGDFDLIMMVTYRNELGYAGVAEQFEAIRAAHQTVLIDGQGLSELGRIVGSTTWFEDGSESD